MFLLSIIIIYLVTVDIRETNLVFSFLFAGRILEALSFGCAIASSEDFGNLSRPFLLSGRELMPTNWSDVV